MLFGIFLGSGPDGSFGMLFGIILGSGPDGSFGMLFGLFLDSGPLLCRTCSDHALFRILFRALSHQLCFRIFSSKRWYFSRTKRC